MAERLHGTSPDRYGAPLIDHVRRVAAAVPREAQTVAWLHEVLESAAVSERQLRALGVTGDEIAAIKLLTRDVDSDQVAYNEHIERIASAAGIPGFSLGSSSARTCETGSRTRCRAPHRAQRAPRTSKRSHA
ncbi:MAG: hypothetical protein ACXVRV_14995 [Gaiellaceae bacterium]